MARISFTIYKHSVLATILDIFGKIYIFLGVMMLFSGAIPVSVIFILFALVLLKVASTVSEKKKFKLWKNKVIELGYDKQIRSSINAAIDLYNTYPGKYTRKYIAKLNPEAGEYIKKQMKKKS